MLKDNVKSPDRGATSEFYGTSGCINAINSSRAANPAAFNYKDMILSLRPDNSDSGWTPKKKATFNKIINDLEALHKKGRIDDWEFTWLTRLCDSLVTEYHLNHFDYQVGDKLIK